MQNQAPGYKSGKKTGGVRKGTKQVSTGGKKQTMSARSKLVKNQVRKTSPYSKNRTGVKTQTMGTGYKSMMLDNAFKHQQVASNNLPGFNFPGAITSL